MSSGSVKEKVPVTNEHPNHPVYAADCLGLIFLTSIIMYCKLKDEMTGDEFSH